MWKEFFEIFPPMLLLKRAKCLSNYLRLRVPFSFFACFARKILRAFSVSQKCIKCIAVYIHVLLNDPTHEEICNEKTMLYIPQNQYK